MFKGIDWMFALDIMMPTVFGVTIIATGMVCMKLLLINHVC